MSDLFDDVENKTLCDLVRRLDKEKISSFKKEVFPKDKNSAICKTEFTVHLKDFEVIIRESHFSYNPSDSTYAIEVYAQDEYLGDYEGQVAEKLYKSLDSRLEKSKQATIKKEIQRFTPKLILELYF